MKTTKYILDILEKMARTMDAVVIVLDNQNKIFWRNEKCLEVFKCPNSYAKETVALEEMIGEFYEGLKNEAVSDSKDAFIKKYISRHRTFEGSIEVQIGSRYFLEEHRKLDQDLSLLVIRDLTNFKKTERELKLSEERLNLAIDGSNSGVFDWNLRTNEIYFSNSIKEILFENSMTEFSYGSLEQRFHPNDLALNDVFSNRYFKLGSKFHFESRLLTKDGIYRWFQFSGSTTYDKKEFPARVLGMLTDIHDKKLAEEALRMSEQRYQQMLRNMMGAVFQVSIDSNFSLLFISDPIEKIIGLYPFEMYEQSINSLKEMVVPEDWRSVESALNKSAQDQKEFEIEFRLFDKNKKYRHVLAKGRNVSSLDSELRILEGFLVDVTERKESEMQLEIAKAKSVTSAKLASLGEMAGGIAHEINNPLAIIMMYSNQLMDLIEDDEAQKDDLKYLLGKIQKTTTRIDKIIRGLKSFARSGEKDPFVPTSIKSIVENTLELCTEKIKKFSVKLNLKNDIDVKIECRESQISQVLLNLVSNAIDAIEHFPEAERWIDIQVLELEGYVKIDVTDCGLGIPSDVVEKMMQPFFTTKEIGKGTGLGLSISKGIIEDHQGRLKYDQQSSHTRFSIILPVKQPQIEAA